jgi:hypothetical protein
LFTQTGPRIIALDEHLTPQLGAQAAGARAVWRFRQREAGKALKFLQMGSVGSMMSCRF